MVLKREAGGWPGCLPTILAGKGGELQRLCFWIGLKSKI